MHSSTQVYLLALEAVLPVYQLRPVAVAAPVACTVTPAACAVKRAVPTNIMNTLAKRSIYLFIYYIYLINIFNITTVVLCC
jgi:hypothetical protein